MRSVGLGRYQLARLSVWFTDSTAESDRDARSEVWWESGFHRPTAARRLNTSLAQPKPEGIGATSAAAKGDCRPTSRRPYVAILAADLD